MCDKSKECSGVLRLMDHDYEYQEALAIILIINPDIDKKELENELNLYV